MLTEIKHKLGEDIIHNYLSTFCSYLSDSTHAQPIQLNIQWVNSFPKRPGVYAVFNSNTVIYVGETGNLRARMKNMLDSRQHVLRRNVGKQLFHNHPNYEQATTSVTFPDVLENMLNDHMESTFSVCAVTVELGRKEIEEELIHRHQPIYNKRGKQTSSK